MDETWRVPAPCIYCSGGVVGPDISANGSSSGSERPASTGTEKLHGSFSGAQDGKKIVANAELLLISDSTQKDQNLNEANDWEDEFWGNYDGESFVDGSEESNESYTVSEDDGDECTGLTTVTGIRGRRLRVEVRRLSQQLRQLRRLLEQLDVDVGQLKYRDEKFELLVSKAGLWIQAEAQRLGDVAERLREEAVQFQWETVQLGLDAETDQAETFRVEVVRIKEQAEQFRLHAAKVEQILKLNDNIRVKVERLRDQVARLLADVEGMRELGLRIQGMAGETRD